ncbi:glycosyltransferase family 2 protein [Thermus thermophilus]|uniref:glycosyltransferase family 2 protein n=1 Tax=Thermus thermophilus TaxID=274 RepID=UPI0011633373|nr:glycosyltransferase family 2 protein [Thermus thermophilus]BBL93411.1 rhamnosyltransferase [Thermus thermophilus]BDG23825.1 rhamnosyltransferase [Thermus thermophilus]
MSEKVCAVIVTYNRKALLRECLKAVLSQTRPPDHVLVVDNASTDGTPEMLQEEFPQVEVLRLPENQGGAGGFHEGMKRAYEQGVDWLWLMDDDTIPKAKALEALLEAARLPLDPRPRVLASRQLLPNGLPHPTTAFVNPTDPRHPFLWLRLRPRYRPIRWALFTSVLLHRSLVEEHGLPHKAFFIWEDDLEYTARALRRGLGLQVRDSEVIHKSASKPYISATTGENRLFYGVRNRIWVLRSPAFGPLGKAFLALQLLFGLLTYLAFHPSRKSLQEIGRALRAGLTTSPC